MQSVVCACRVADLTATERVRRRLRSCCPPASRVAEALSGEGSCHVTWSGVRVGPSVFHVERVKTLSRSVVGGPMPGWCGGGSLIPVMGCAVRVLVQV